MATEYCIALVTAPDKKTADKLVEGLIKGKLAACVNVFSGIQSTYWWEDKVENSEEFLLVLKTRIGLVPEICEFVKQNHPYTVPEVIAVNIEDGNEGYLNWIGANTIFKPKPRAGMRRTGPKGY